MFKAILLGIISNLILLNTVLGKRGEVGPDGKEITPAPGADEKKFSQLDVDSFIQKRVAIERKKYPDYEELKTFKTEHEKSIDAAAQKSLEEQKNYEELKKGFAEKEKNYTEGLSAKDVQISSLKISHALTNEILKHNAYPEAAQILQGMVTLSDDGTPQMSGKDTVGNITKVTLEEGVKKFLEERPHLVKANGGDGGGGTPPGGGGGGQGAGGVTLNDLNKQLLAAKATNNHKLVEEIKTKIRTDFSDRGVNRNI